jgi:hypothetical protein
MELIKCARYEKWSSGKVMCRQGQIPSYFLVILDGEVDITSVSTQTDVEEGSYIRTVKNLGNMVS